MNEHSLLPCPFCGGLASDSGKITYHNYHEAWWADGTRITEAYYVNCMMCGGNNQGPFGHQTKEEAVRHWNTRAEIPVPAASS